MPRLPETTVADVPADAVLLDVREDAEWAVGHAPGATHVPLSELPARAPDVPPGDPLYVVCRVGGRSAQVTAWLVAQGVDAVNVQGGMLQWEREGRPMVTDDGSAPAVL